MSEDKFIMHSVKVILLSCPKRLWIRMLEQLKKSEFNFHTPFRVLTGASVGVYVGVYICVYMDIVHDVFKRHWL